MPDDGPGAGSLDSWLRATLAGEEPPAWRGWPPSYADAPGPSTARLRARPVPTAVSAGGPYADVEHGLDDADATPLGGPLAGFSFAVKNMVAVAGVRSQAGSRARAEVEPEAADAAAVAALRAAGGRYVGATAMHELAFGVTGVNDFEGTAPNPWDPERIPGGSSSGSAVAVAEGSARVALGTDTGGSIRIPAALCGVVGFKPSHGLYGLDGILPLAPTLDHLGVFAGSVEDAIRVHAVLAGEEVGAATSPPSLLYSPAHLESATPAVRERFQQACTQLTAAGAEPAPVLAPGLDLAYATSTAILLSEAAAVHETTLRERGELLGPELRERLEAGAALPHETYELGLAARAELIAQAEQTLGESALLIGPTVGEVAPRLDGLGDPTIVARLVAHTRLANATGLPAVSIPLPTSGLPIGLQITGRADAEVLAAAAWVGAVLEIR